MRRWWGGGLAWGCLLLTLSLKPRVAILDLLALALLLSLVLPLHLDGRVAQCGKARNQPILARVNPLHLSLGGLGLERGTRVGLSDDISCRLLRLNSLIRLLLRELSANARRIEPLLSAIGVVAEERIRVRGVNRRRNTLGFEEHGELGEVSSVAVRRHRDPRNEGAGLIELQKRCSELVLSLLRIGFGICEILLRDVVLLNRQLQVDHRIVVGDPGVRELDLDLSDGAASFLGFGLDRVDILLGRCRERHRRNEEPNKGSRADCHEAPNVHERFS